MTGTPPPAHSPVNADVTSLDADALRARLASVEASLTQTRLDLSSAQQTIAARDAAPPALREAEPGGGNRGGPSPDGATALPPGAPVAPGGTATGEATSGAAAFVLPTLTAGRTAADYEAAADGDGSEATSDYRGLISGPRGERRGFGRADCHDDWAVEGYNDGFDKVLPPAASDWLTAFDIPRSIVRPDGMPVPFSPDDGVHNTTFASGSRDEIEARHWYCSLAWTQLIYNEALAARSAPDASIDRLREVIEYFACSLRRLYALGVSRYDYLSLRQTEPALAEAFSHADAVPRNTLRGDGARRYLARVARQETHATAKLGAADRGFVYPHRGGRASTVAAAPVATPKQPDPADGRRQQRNGGPARGGGRGGRGRGANRA